MKAKACTKCRQWKTRCDAPERSPDRCSRCRSLDLTCVFDPSFKRQSRRKCMQQMSEEIQQLRQSLANPSLNNDTPAPPQPLPEIIDPPQDLMTWNASLPGTSDGTSTSPAQFSTSLSTSTGVAAVSLLSEDSRSLGNVCLTKGQIERLFKTYFSRNHRHLPFTCFSETPDEVYSSSTLLFWVICAVTSNWKQQALLAPMVRSMIAQSIHTSSNSVETVQALLIMCMWPFKSVRMSEDPSQYYCGIAVQMSLQLGLHRPGQPYWPLQHGSISGPLVSVQEDVRLSTWLACYVVSQLQSSYLGIPSCIMADTNLLNAFDNAVVDHNLSQLCHISHLLMKSCWEIGANAPTPMGILEPLTRVRMVRYYGQELASLQKQHLATVGDMVHVMFLYTKLQLLSFALLEDVPYSEDLGDLVAEAEAAACEVIEITQNMNLSMTPVHVRRALCYAGFILFHVLKQPRETQRELLHDSIESARECLATTASAPEDIVFKACEILRELPFLEDKRRTPPILSRMGASIFFDTLRVHWENMNERDFNFDMTKFDWNSLGL